jgi:hypothetical protein
MTTLIEAEVLDEDGQMKKQSNPHHLHRCKQAKKTMQNADDSDKDSNFLISDVIAQLSLNAMAKAELSGA